MPITLDRVLTDLDAGKTIFSRLTVAGLVALIVEQQATINKLKAEVSDRDACIEGWQELSAHLSTMVETH